MNIEIFKIIAIVLSIVFSLFIMIRRYGVMDFIDDLKTGELNTKSAILLNFIVLLGGFVVVFGLTYAVLYSVLAVIFYW